MIIARASEKTEKARQEVRARIQELESVRPKTAEQQAELTRAEARTWNVPGGEVRRLSQLIMETEHTLIAGTTGCGKSVLLSEIITDILRSYAPNEARLYLIDPKKTELDRWKELPHVRGYADNPVGAVEILRRAVELMDCRYDILKQNRQQKWSAGRVYVIIDELLPLMISPQVREIRRLLTLLLTQGRAAGIVIIAATQAPNRKIIPAELVCCFTTRVGMKCVFPIESRQIIGDKGCELLPKHGLVYIVSGCDLYRAAVELPRDNEIENIINHWMKQVA